MYDINDFWFWYIHSKFVQFYRLIHSVVLAHCAASMVTPWLWVVGPNASCTTFACSRLLSSGRPSSLCVKGYVTCGLPYTAPPLPFSRLETLSLATRSPAVGFISVSAFCVGPEVVCKRKCLQNEVATWTSKQMNEFIASGGASPSGLGVRSSGSGYLAVVGVKS